MADHEKSDFDKFLDNIDKEPQPEAAADAETQPAPAEEAPPAVEDPLAKYIGHQGPIVTREVASPFDGFLAQLEAEAPADLEPAPEKSFEEHDWETVRQTRYEDDFDVWRCKRCFRQVNVNRQETLVAALERHKINPDCGVQVAAEVMES